MPDHAAVEVDQRSAGVAGVDRGVGLDHRLGADRRSRALTTPEVTVPLSPSGEPTAMTG